VFSPNLEVNPRRPTQDLSSGPSVTESDARMGRKRRLVWSLSFGVAGLASALVFVHEPVGKGWQMLPYAAGIASLLAAWLTWGLMRPMTSARRGALTGAVIGLLSHPPAWYLAILWHYLVGARSSTGDEPLDPIMGITGSLVFSFWSLLLTGWLTIPVGAVLGVVLAKRLTSPAGERGNRE
jgi:hypothetical protein